MKQLVNTFGKFITVTYNGKAVKFFRDGIDVLNYISKTIIEKDDYNLKLLFDMNIDINTILVIYEYNIVEKEMFLIEIGDL